MTRVSKEATALKNVPAIMNDINDRAKNMGHPVCLYIYIYISHSSQSTTIITILATLVSALQLYRQYIQYSKPSVQKVDAKYLYGRLRIELAGQDMEQLRIAVQMYKL